MLCKYRALIITVSAVVIAVAVIIGVGIHHFNIFHLADEHDPVPALSAEEKEKVDAEVKGIEITSWYDENGYKEESGVWRYVGTYGDCYAFLMYELNITPIFDPITLPIDLQGLSRPVAFHHNASVMLYHTTQAFTFSEIYGEGDNSRLQSWAYLKNIANRNQWLTDEQLEELTQDIIELARGRVKCPDGHLIDPCWDWVCTDCQNDSRQPVPQSVKDDLKEAYGSELIWYDENGGVEEEFVWRYIGKYGNNYAFLKIRGETDALGRPVANPYPLKGVYGDIYYPHNALVVLYNDEKESPLNLDTIRHWASLADARKSGGWITDYQWKRLSQDIEKMAEGRV